MSHEIQVRSSAGQVGITVSIDMNADVARELVRELDSTPALTAGDESVIQQDKIRELGSVLSHHLEAIDR